MTTKDQKTDYLKEDPVIPGQNWCVVSFVSPTDRVLEKNLYYVNKFFVQDVNKSILAQATQMVKKLDVDMRNRIGSVLDKLRNSVDEEDKHLYRILNEKFNAMKIDEEEYLEECNRLYTMKEADLLDKYKIYLTENRKGLDKDFDDAHDHACSVRGFKVRGTYARLEDAQERAKFVRDSVEPGVHAYVVPQGAWFPVDMDADEVQDQDYMLPALNDLMGKYHAGQRAKDKFFEERKQELMVNPEASRVDKMRNKLRKKMQEKKKKEMKKQIDEMKKAQGN